MVRKYGQRYEWTKGDQGGLSVFGIDIPAPYMELFKWAYRKHDAAYQYSKADGGRTRKEIDQELLEDMIKIAQMKGDKNAEKLAHIIYHTVRALGWIPWMNKSNSI